MKKDWVLLQSDPEKVSKIVRFLGISETIASVLVNRGVDTVEKASQFLQNKLKSLADPVIMKDSEKASKIIIDAIKKRKKIIIYGDYDVDGITSTVIMYEFLFLLGANVVYHIPHRLEDGYGLNTYALEEIATEGADLVVTVDCGITSIDEVNYAKSLGLDVIIVDHHHVGERVPNASAIINPHQKECEYPFKELAAVGVAFSLCMVLKKFVEKDGFFKGTLPNLIDYMDIVALGTVADMVPLLESNRIFVKHGLKQLQKNNRPGIEALAKICGLNSLTEITPSTISYKMAPRLNAAGRIGNAIKGVELLLSKDYDHALKIAEELNLTNEYRQKLEAEIFEQAIAMVEKDALYNNSSIVLASKNWHPGVIGIVASRLVERYFKPTVMISIEGGVGRGSARSIPKLHIYHILENLSSLLVQYGGHKFAAGLTIAEDNIKTFIELFEDRVKNSLQEEDYINLLQIDNILDLDKLSPELVVALSKLEPFGMNNPEPNFIARNLVIKKQNIINRSHLHWKLKYDKSGFLYDSIGFSLLAEREPPNIDNIVDIVYFPRINVWGGNVSLQLYIKDYKVVG